MAYRTVLYPTDLSPAGDAAAELAYGLVADKGTVHVLHVVEPAFLASPFDMTPVMVTPPSPEALADIEDRAVKHAKGLVPKSAATRGVRTETHVVHEVGTASVIERMANQVGAEAIVMGTHGRTGLGRLLMGSVATEVLKASHLPVILARTPKDAKK